MTSEVIKNRVILANLIFSMGSFTEDDLEKRFASKALSPNLGGEKTIFDYLWDLRQYGTLNYDMGVYQVAEEGCNKFS